MATAPSPDSSADPPSTSQRLAGAAGIMMVAILASRLLGLVRDAVISGRFGQGFDSDVYYAAFMIPDLLFFLIAGGALSSAFIPVFTEKITQGQVDVAWHVFSTVACIMCVIVSGFILMGELFTAPLIRLMNYGFTDAKVAETVPLTRIVLPAQLCFFLGGLLMGAQYAQQRFFIPALGPIIYNLGIIFGGVFLAGWLGVAGLCWGALFGAALGNFGLQWWATARTGMRFRLSFDGKHPEVMKVWRLMLPVVFGLALPQVSILVNKMFASSLGDGPQSALTRANQLMQVPLGVFAQAMAVAIFPTLSAQAAQRRYADLRATSSLGIRFLLFLTIPASAFMIVLAAPIVQLLLEHGKFGPADTTLTASALVCYAIGIFAWSAQSILSRSFYAMQDSRTPVLIGTAVTLVFIPLNWLFMSALGLGYRGLALATTVAAILHMFAMLAVLRRRLGGIEGGRLAKSASQVSLASAAAAVACWGAKGAVDAWLGAAPGKMHAAAALVVGLLVGGTIYSLCALLLKVEEMKRLRDLLRRRVSRE